MKRFNILLLTLLLPTTILLQVSHATIIGAVVDNGNGTFTYNYEVDNTLGTFDIAVWSLEFDIAPDWDQLDSLSGGDVDVPNFDWFADAGIPTSGTSAQDFISLDPFADVLAGDTLAGFSFTSSFAPGTINYFEFDGFGTSASSLTVGPTAAGVVIPEPSSWALLAIGLVSIMLKRNIFRKSNT